MRIKMANSLPNEDSKNALLGCLSTHGGSLGNKKAQNLLGCSDEVYQTIKAALLNDGRITLGRGKGGSIHLKESIESSSTSSNDTEQETFSTSPQPGGLDLESRENLRNKLEEFRSQAGRKREYCSSNERQTERLLVEPYLEILGIHTQDPERLKAQFRTGIGRDGETVDYAVLEAGRPIWLIEVKSAQTDLPNEITRQLKRYAVDTQAPFASLTNGIHWHWYMWSDNRGLEDTPFLKSDVLRRPTDLELDWLAIVCKGLDKSDVENKARSMRMVGKLANWLRRIAQDPSQELLCLALGECGFPTGKSWVDSASAVLPQAWAHCMDAQPPSDSNWGAHLPAPVERATTMPHVLSTMPSLGTGVHTNNPGEPIGRANRKARYRVSRDQGWVECSNATQLVSNIIEWCAKEHRNGVDDYYKKLSFVQIYGRPFLIADGSDNWRRLPLDRKNRYASELVNGWRVFNTLPNREKTEMIGKILTTCIKEDGTHPVQGQDVWVEMPNAS